jgi:hypothetical protein
MVGNGNTQASTPTYWQHTIPPGPADDIWTDLTYPNPAINSSGYKTNATREIRWAENEIGAVHQTASYGSGDVRAFTTSFNNGALPQEGQAVVGDSGGAVLFYNGAE